MLFHLGDGHAVQGCGEIVGTGIEISLDVRFTVQVFKGKTIGWPRGESDTHWFCIGNARPLEQTMQHATTEMLAMLTKDYGLTAQKQACSWVSLWNTRWPIYSTPPTASFVKFQKPCCPCYKRTVYLEWRSLYRIEPGSIAILL
ncbi:MULTISPECIES: acetamidase/formamidase family protein [Paenibacillus]|uniref:acetamidase/formamidase family protein n=1 Tax=Paenibacillus TaxID=44249 RepID=UPI002281D98E|nr:MULTISPECIES: acetamidase/formamidase family protein [Paenibacillus]MCY7486908.1 acetamidase/formamidase family protein [Paenibacillus alvei]